MLVLELFVDISMLIKILLNMFLRHSVRLIWCLIFFVGSLMMLL